MSGKARKTHTLRLQLTTDQAKFLLEGVKELQTLEPQKSKDEIIDGLLWLGLETAKRLKVAAEHQREERLAHDR